MHNLPIPLVADRMAQILQDAWDICMYRIATGRIKINKESSLQLHYAFILVQVGELACLDIKDMFGIELETKHGRKNIDICCSLGTCSAAIEMKCFRKASNRAVDIDMYDVLKDISRLESYSHVTLRRFICLTDNIFYTNQVHKGYSAKVNIGNGIKYKKNVVLKPPWVGKWKNKSRDKDIVFNHDIEFNWRSINPWYYLFMNIK